MREIKAEKISVESFAPFGSFYDFANPDGYALQGKIHRFFPDRLTEMYNTRMGFSAIAVKRPKTMIITSVEYHTTTPEVIMPLNDAMIIHVAPASAGVVVTSETKAFIVPPHTMVKINTAIWHLAPLPVHVEELNVVILLPECAYMNDITVIELAEEEIFKIVL